MSLTYCDVPLHGYQSKLYSMRLSRLKILETSGLSLHTPSEESGGKTKVHYLLSLKYYFEYIYIYDMYILYCIHTYICIIIHRLYQRTLKRSLCP